VLRFVCCSLLLSLGVLACRDAPTGSEATSVLAPVSCPAPKTSDAVLVDASHDGGVWWFPQVAPFDTAQSHQGQELANTLRGKGYQVDELWRGEMVSRKQLLDYQIVIRAGAYGGYTRSELDAYEDFVACPRTLILLSEYLRAGEHDGLAHRLGIVLSGSVTGNITTFATDSITADVGSVTYLAGSVVDVEQSQSVRVLGWLEDGQPVMGIQEGRRAKLFFMGDTNSLEFIPQPLVDNLVAWGF